MVPRVVNRSLRPLPGMKRWGLSRGNSGICPWHNAQVYLCAALRSAKLATSMFVVTSWPFSKIACLAASSQVLANSAWLIPAAASNTDSQSIEAVEKLS